tara:strand:+ start:233 stop:1300 length:1068 start_codon:yes stop_codon:yes gene_type:complete
MDTQQRFLPSVFWVQFLAGAPLYSLTDQQEIIMKLNVTGLDDTIMNDGTAKNGKGGTERMREELMRRLPDDMKDQFNIICSRVRDVPENKKNILWLHDVWNDSENAHLKEAGSIDRFEKLVFVSNSQAQAYRMVYDIPHSKSIVLRNAIEIFKPLEKEKTDTLRLIYHTTPHRGLEILYPVFAHLYEQYNQENGVKLELDVYSNFDIYGWPQRNEQYENLYELCRQHPGINYHGTVSNEEVREALVRAHIFAYPNIWEETSCIAAIEAMSAKVAIVCPNYGALAETTGNLATAMYPWSEDINAHANQFANVLSAVINNYWHEGLQSKLTFGKTYTDNIHDWDSRIEEWMSMLKSF